ncbi:LysR family transcriptional regulator [Ideonella sp.]|uniref:LysR family transcriptional regulator n=1 Tax=Ideonella sp. TaxID=1929293 RepID=UPI0035B1941B
MTLQQLRDFVAVVAHGGYRSAARALGVAQAGLTKSVARLEQEHGVVLLDRTAKGIALSADGAEFLQRAQALLREADRAEAWLLAAAQPQGPSAQDIALGVSVEPSLHVVPAVLADFHRVWPKVTVRLTEGVASALLAGVRENRLELAVTRLPANFEDGDLVVAPLFESESIVAARLGHPLASAPVAVADLVACDWVVVGDPAHPAHDDPSIHELFVARGLARPMVAAVTDSLFGAIAMLAQSDALARLPRAVLEHPLARGHVGALPLREPASPRYTVAVVHKAARPLSREARTLAAMLASFARSRPDPHGR